jgi:UDP-N-acetylmuramoylalanine--D-glutamate ligase
MEAAIASAAQLTAPGIDVLLSPGCTSYDWYNNYKERGDDFVRLVRRHFSSTTDQVNTTGGGNP